MTPPATRLHGLDSLSPVPACTAQHLPAVPEDHAEPFAAYVRAMARELEANREKGGREDWQAMEPRVLVTEVLYHAAKLMYAVRAWQSGHGSSEDVVEFAADIGNLAMMVPDAAGVLVGDEVTAGA